MATHFEMFFATNTARDHVVRTGYTTAPLGTVEYSAMSDGLRKEAVPMKIQHIGGAGPIGGRKFLCALGALPLSAFEEDVNQPSPASQ